MKSQHLVNTLDGMKTAPPVSSVQPATNSRMSTYASVKDLPNNNLNQASAKRRKMSMEER